MSQPNANQDEKENLNQKKNLNHKLKRSGFVRPSQPSRTPEHAQPVSLPNDATPEMRELMARQFLNGAEARKEDKGKDPELRSDSILYRMNLKDRIALEALCLHLNLKMNGSLRFAVNNMLKEVPAATLKEAEVRAKEYFAKKSVDRIFKKRGPKPKNVLPENNED